MVYLLETLTPSYLESLLPVDSTITHPVSINPLEKQGVSSAMYSVTVAYTSGGFKKKTEFILRVYKEGLEHKGLKEFQLLTALKKSNVLVPKVYGFTPKKKHKEKTFMIMEKMNGKPTDELMHEQSNPDLIVDRLAQVLSDIHKLHPNIITEKDKLQSQYDYQVHYLTKMRSLVQKGGNFRFFCSPLQKKFIRSLKCTEALQPPSYQPTIIHVEFMPCHVLVSNDQFTVVDWGDALVGDPAYDVAWIYHELNLMYKKNKNGLGDQFIKSYEKYSSRKLANLEFCKDIVALKLAWWYGLLPFPSPTFFSFYVKIVDLTFGNIIGRLTRVPYIRQIQNRMKYHHYNSQRSIDLYQKYVVQYFEEQAIKNAYP